MICVLPVSLLEQTAKMKPKQSFVLIQQMNVHARMKKEAMALLHAQIHRRRQTAKILAYHAIATKQIAVTV